MELDRAVGTWGVGRAEIAPQPRPGRYLHRHRLAWHEQQVGLGTHLDDRDVESPPLDRGHVTCPPCRAGAFGRFGCGDHDRGDHPVGLGPVRRDLIGPALTQKVLQRGEQGCSDRVVVPGDDLEAPVVAAQLLDERSHLVELIHARHDSAERTDEPIALCGHRDREHAPQLGVGQEQVRVEEQGHLVLEGLGQRPRLLQCGGVHRVNRPPRGSRRCRIPCRRARSPRGR